MSSGSKTSESGGMTGLDNDSLVFSSDALHPANLICELCKQFYGLGWVNTITFLWILKNTDFLRLRVQGMCSLNFINTNQ